MKSNSTIYPSNFYKSQGKIFINDLLNVIENLSDGITIYTYDAYELPIVDRDTLEEYVSDNYEILLEFAKNKESVVEMKPLTLEQLDDAVTYILSNM